MRVDGFASPVRTRCSRFSKPRIQLASVRGFFFAGEGGVSPASVEHEPHAASDCIGVRFRASGTTLDRSSRGGARRPFK